MSTRTAMPSRLAHLARPLASPGSIHPVLRKPAAQPAQPNRVPDAAAGGPQAPRESAAAAPAPSTPRVTVTPASRTLPAPASSGWTGMPAAEARGVPRVHLPAGPSAPSHPGSGPFPAAGPAEERGDRGLRGDRVVRVGMARVPVRWLTRL